MLARQGLLMSADGRADVMAMLACLEKGADRLILTS